MNILTNTAGEFIFLTRELTTESFSDFRDIPQGYQFREVIKFVPAIPPAPHTAQQHADIAWWNETFSTILKTKTINS